MFFFVYSSDRGSPGGEIRRLGRHFSECHLSCSLKVISVIPIFLSKFNLLLTSHFYFVNIEAGDKFKLLIHMPELEHSQLQLYHAIAKKYFHKMF